MLTKNVRNISEKRLNGNLSLKQDKINTSLNGQW